MEKERLILFSIIGVVGYAVFHGHRLNRDCFLCKYRGLAFLTASVGAGAFFAFD
jgi:hypothetical protein